MPLSAYLVCPRFSFDGFTAAETAVDRPHWKDLEDFLFARAMEHDSPKLLFRLACEYLSSSRLVPPGVVLVLERVATARKRARKETWQRVEPILTGFLRDEMDGMLVPGPLGRANLRVSAARSSPSCQPSWLAPEISFAGSVG